MSNTRPFKIYYAILLSNTITNCVAPGYRHVTGDKTPEGEKKRLEAQNQYINRLNQKDQFYIKLEKSIKVEGFVNPILVQAGYCSDIYRKYLPIAHQNDLSKCLCCDRHGGSRLYVAQKYDLDIPCIISDFSGMFADSNFEELHNDQEILRKFKVRAKAVVINGHGVHVCEPVHVHLEKRYGQVAR